MQSSDTLNTIFWTDGYSLTSASDNVISGQVAPLYKLKSLTTVMIHDFHIELKYSLSECLAPLLDKVWTQSGVDRYANIIKHHLIKLYHPVTVY